MGYGRTTLGSINENPFATSTRYHGHLGPDQWLQPIRTVSSREYQQENYSNDAEILFVVDNSSSMQAESEELAIEFDTFIQFLTDPTQGGATYEGLDDAVDNYIRYVSERGRF